MPTRPCYFMVCLVALASAGCCCDPCGGPLGGNGRSACQSGPVVGGGLFGLAGCRTGCGEVYVDEWISEPPTADNCGYDCGGCGSCNQCQPIRNALRLLWGRPYVASCDSGACDAGFADDGFSSNHHGTASHHVASGCNCGQPHHSIPSTRPLSPAPESLEAPIEIVPPANQPSPTPAPTIAPSSARRLNPAQQRR